MKLDQARGTTESEIIFRHMEMIFHPAEAAEAPRGKGRGIFSMAVRHPFEFMEVVRYNLEDGYHEIEKTAGFLGMNVHLLSVALGAVLVLFLSFFLTTLLKRRDFLPGLFLILLFTPALVFVIVTIEHRYFYPFMPLGLIIVARIMAGWEDAARASGSRLKKGGYYLIAGLVVLGMVAGSGGVIYRKWKKIGIPYEYKLIGEWMRAGIPGIEKENVMMFRMGVSHYAGCRWNVFYWGDYPGLCDYLRKRGINYLIVDDYKLHMIHPDLRFLMTAVALPAEFSPVREFEFGGRRVRLLKFEKRDNGVRQDPGHDLSPPL